LSRGPNPGLPRIIHELTEVVIGFGVVAHDSRILGVVGIVGTHSVLASLALPLPSVSVFVSPMGQGYLPPASMVVVVFLLSVASVLGLMILSTPSKFSTLPLATTTGIQTELGQNQTPDSLGTPDIIFVLLKLTLLIRV